MLGYRRLVGVVGDREALASSCECEVVGLRRSGVNEERISVLQLREG